MPRDMRVVGADIDIRRVKSYLGRAAELLAYAQSKIVVFGSGRSRNVPDGFDREKAEAQFIDSLLWSADALKGLGHDAGDRAVEPKRVEYRQLGRRRRALCKSGKSSGNSSAR